MSTDPPRRWSRWWQLPGADKRTVLRVTWLLVIADLSLRMFGLRRTRRWFLHGAQDVPAQTPSAQDLASAQRLAALTAAAGQYGVYRATCLRQALVVERCLRRRGLPVQLQVGTRKNAQGDLDAHAWVELDGVALGQTQPEHGSIAGVDSALR